MLNTCLIISTALAMVILLVMIALLKIQNAIQAERIQWQQEQIQTLQTQQHGLGCGAILLIALLVAGSMVLVSLAVGAAGVP
jgi:hypothetical protein